MSNRFTATDKWSDKWFMGLSPDQKLAWLYICDNCDQAGVIEVNEHLADFQIGFHVDWELFLDACGKRIEKLSSGKLWVVGFIEFQQKTKELNPKNNYHKSVVGTLNLQGINFREFGYTFDVSPLIPTEVGSPRAGPSEALARGSSKSKSTSKSTSKSKSKEMVSPVSGSSIADDWDIPEHLDCPDVRSELGEFAAMRRRIKKPIRSLQSSSRALKKFTSVPQLLRALDVCIANDYQGLKVEYGEEKRGSRASGPGIKHTDDAKGAHIVGGI